jgi:hypothetical protein
MITREIYGETFKDEMSKIKVTTKRKLEENGEGATY